MALAADEDGDGALASNKQDRRRDFIRVGAMNISFSSSAAADGSLLRWYCYWYCCR
jgi:hypothetical protein